MLLTKVLLLGVIKEPLYFNPLRRLKFKDDEKVVGTFIFNTVLLVRFLPTPLSAKEESSMPVNIAVNNMVFKFFFIT